VPPRIVWVTNDLPPRTGGIQQFVVSLLERTARADTVVLGPAGGPGAAAWDAGRPWRTERAPGDLLPTPATGRWLADRLAGLRPDAVVIASLWPLGLLAPRLRRAAAAPVLGLTHGAEAGLARGPLRPVLRAVARDVDLVTTISDFTAGPVAAALGGHRVARLPPGVDTARFVPRPADDPGRLAMRRAWGVPEDAVVVGCVARLVPRKGQDALVAAWPRVAARHPDARLVLVGEGPLRRRLERAVARAGPAGDRVVLAGAVPWERLPDAYAALDVFAMPVRTRLGGLDVEGLGISFLEALATGLPVVVGRSGGAPETLVHPDAGDLVDGRDLDAVVDALDRWLGDASARRAVATLAPPLVRRWEWDSIAADLDALLGGLVTA
jgi:phosphatidylinositol alpha-1,6-mannosyltransferase